MVKAYSAFLEYLKSKAQRRMLDGAESCQERTTLQFHITMLDTTKTVMTEKKHLSSAKRQGKEHTASMKMNLNILYPDLQEAIRDCVKNWNKSEINKDHLRKLVDIYDAAKRTRTVHATDYQHGVQYAVFVLAALSKVS